MNEINIAQPDTPNPTTIYAVVDDKYCLPLAEAVKVLTLLATAQRVEQTYGDLPFKPSKSSATANLKVLTMSHFACLQLDRTD